MRRRRREEAIWIASNFVVDINSMTPLSENVCIPEMTKRCRGIV